MQVVCLLISFVWLHSLNTQEPFVTNLPCSLRNNVCKPLIHVPSLSTNKAVGTYRVGTKTLKTNGGVV